MKLISQILVSDSLKDAGINKINDMVNKMKSSPDWLKTIQQKAIDNNRLLEEQIQLDAKWALDNQ